MNYLFTFATTTSAFKAEKALKEGGVNAEAVSVPFELSKTCYGLGVAFESDAVEKPKALLAKEEIGWRRLWGESDGKYALVAEGEEK